MTATAAGSGISAFTLQSDRFAVLVRGGEPYGSVRAGRKGGAAMLSLRVKLALVTLASFVVAALVGGNTWSV